jgi:LysM repeat protein
MPSWKSGSGEAKQAEPLFLRGYLRNLYFLDPYFGFWDFGPVMKASFRHLACIGVLLCGNVSGQTATYTVKPGDNLSKIARNQGCTVEALAKANGIKLSAVIKAGQTLKLPGKGAPTASGGSSHTIQPGDTLSSISRQHNISVETLQAANPGLDPKTLKLGQKILLAASEKQAAAKPPASKAEVTRKPATVQPAGASENPAPSAVKHQPVATPPTSHTEKQDAPAAASTPQAVEEKVSTVVVDTEMTFGEFATQHGSDIKRLNELNGLDLAGATVLAKGSELYVPAQPQTDSQR